MQKITIYPTSIDRRAIAHAAEVLDDGGIIIYPTDTVYAMGCDSLSNKAIERLCAIKGINPAKQHLSVVCADISQAAEYARIDNRAFSVLKSCLPGPYTFILPVSPKLPKAFKGRRTVGIRVPDNDIARALAAELGRPVLSASLTPDPDDKWQFTDPDALMLACEGKADLIIDGGEGDTQLSTIADLTDSSSPETIRHGKGEPCW